MSRDVLRGNISLSSRMWGTVNRINDSVNSLNCLLEDMRVMRLTVMVPYCYITFLENKPNAHIFDSGASGSSVWTSAVPNPPDVATLIDDPQIVIFEYDGSKTPPQAFLRSQNTAAKHLTMICNYMINGGDKKSCSNAKSSSAKLNKRRSSNDSIRSDSMNRPVSDRIYCAMLCNRTNYMAAALRRSIPECDQATSNLHADMAILAMRKAAHYSFCTWNTNNIKVVHRDFRPNDVTIVRADNSCILVKREFHAIIGLIGVCYLKNGPVYALSTTRNDCMMACGVLSAESHEIIPVENLNNIIKSSATRDEHGVYWFKSPPIHLKVSFQNFNGLSFHKLRAYGVVRPGRNRITPSENFYPPGPLFYYPTEEQTRNHQRDILQQYISTHGLLVTL